MTERINRNAEIREECEDYEWFLAHPPADVSQAAIDRTRAELARLKRMIGMT